MAVWTSEFVFKTFEVIQQLMTDPHRNGLEKLMLFGEHLDELVNLFSRFCVIHLEVFTIAHGKVESGLIGHRVIWYKGGCDEWKKRKWFHIQQLATNPSTNGMEVVLDLHDFVCCADDMTKRR